MTERTAPAGLPTRPDAVQLRARRNPRLVIAGVLCAALGGLGAAVVHAETSSSAQVLMAARDVSRGEVVQTSDLAVVTIGSAPGVNTVPASELSSLVGGEARVDLPSGSLVGDGAVGEPEVAKGTSQLGLRLAAGRLPVKVMPAGTRVTLVAVTGTRTGADDGVPSLRVTGQIVSSPVPLADGASYVLDVAVPQASAQQVADLAAREQLVIVREGGN
ncbi:MAG TPA: SAF domain-containing protein [Propionibacteriaceae bacterium]|nr:SAF domain-containing protein [Propionibacteriaceae bacterium]